MEKLKILVADVETDAIHRPRNLWMVGILDYHTDEFTPYHGDEGVAEGLMRLMDADVIIGHHFIGYDAKQIKMLTEGVVDLPKTKIIDTLDMSRKHCELEDHKLGRWGDMFGFPKGDFKEFHQWSPKMIPYCERDCRITKMIFDFVNDLAVEQGYSNYLELIKG